jgi:hypothetical protein
MGRYNVLLNISLLSTIDWFLKVYIDYGSTGRLPLGLILHKHTVSRVNTIQVLCCQQLANSQGTPGTK